MCVHMYILIILFLVAGSLVVLPSFLVLARLMLLRKRWCSGVVGDGGGGGGDIGQLSVVIAGLHSQSSQCEFVHCLPRLQYSEKE